MKVKIIGLVASPRKNGNTNLLVNACLAAARELKDVETECIQLADYKYAGGCSACHMCYKDPGKLCHSYRDDHNKVLEKVLTGDGFIFGSPVYCGGLTAQMKMFIDRLECVGSQAGSPLRNKPFGCVTSGGARHGGQELTILGLMQSFMVIDMIPITPITVFNVEGMGGFHGVTGVHIRHLPKGVGPTLEIMDSKDGVKGDEAALACAHTLGLRVAEMAKVINAGFTIVNPENGETKWPAHTLTAEFLKEDYEAALAAKEAKKVLP